jgi:chaperonin GroEL
VSTIQKFNLRAWLVPPILVPVFFGLLIAGAINAGEDGSVIVGKILEKDQYSYGFDSQTGEYGNLISKGIIDPTKVVRVAIQNAASVAALLITTEAMVAEVPKKNAGGGGMGGMGGMDF